MKPLGLNEIREKYLSFFETKQHLRMQSFPLVPINDKSLLLINSGMAPLKPYFTGEEAPPSKRVTTCQKCIRTPDIENVGKTARHGTFFEMLGNFSFGNYFKNEAIPWAWEFVTEVLEIPKDKLWITIYKDDDEAFEIWNKKVGIPDDKIVRMGKEDNFWEIGIGPCGPCSELYYDRGEEFSCGSPECAVGCECDRYVEFWNLVFTQFDKDEKGNYNKLENPNIDTGMGLERMATIMQGVNTIFEVDTIKHVLDYICNLANVSYGKDSLNDISIRVITDHVRSVTFMIGDGVLPSNEGRGYVLRRLLRRAARHGKLLGIEGTFLYDVSKELIKVSGEAYPELREKEAYIKKVIKIEEERFQETLDQGLTILQNYISELKEKNEIILSGAKAFKLYDTFGFPLDLTKEILDEFSITVDEETFNKEMEEQRSRARSARVESDIEGWKEDPFAFVKQDVIIKFVGYEKLKEDCQILGLVADNNQVLRVENGGKVLILLDKTPFYAESGGQVGDKGEIISQTGKIQIFDCKKGSLGRNVHYGNVIEGYIEKGQSVIAKVDNKKRLSIQRNHTCTHIMHKALRETLGDHVAQAGSLVSEDRLRFDFNHFQKLSNEELKKVEYLVNEIILDSLPVELHETDIKTAKAMGATALFGEKYGENVRVVKVGDYSIELCGGTHLNNASQIGYFKIISESGIAAGVRRIEATTGWNSIEYLNNRENIILETAHIIKTTPENSINRLQELTHQIKDQEKEILELKRYKALNKVNDIIKLRKNISGVDVVISKLQNYDMNDLRQLGDNLRDQVQSGIVVLANISNEKVNLLSMGSKDVVEKGFHAGNLIREIAKVVGGGGGGRPDMAQAGGKKPNEVEHALLEAEKIIMKQLANN